jgi:hypothetical protein
MLGTMIRPSDYIHKWYKYFGKRSQGLVPKSPIDWELLKQSSTKIDP